MPQFEFSLILQLSHDTFHERGFTLAITTYESYLVATFYSKIHAVEYLLIIKRHGYIAHLYRIGTAARTWRELEAKATGVFFIHLDKFKFLQHLYAALHLKCFGISTFEALNEILSFGYHLLLLLIFLHLLFATFLAQFQILAIGSLVVVDAPHSNLDGTSSNVIYKLAVVADDNHGFRTVDDEILKPTDRFDVEMIGRLIQQQDIRRFQQ